MVRKLNHHFKNILTMNVIVGSVVMAGANATNIDKTRFSSAF